MKIVVEVSEKDYQNFLSQYKADILDERTPSHRAKIAIAEGQILPDNAEILTAEAYSDLCLRASEQKVGKWHLYRCSECKRFCSDLIRGYYEIVRKPNYCPNCGAKMEGAEE